MSGSRILLFLFLFSQATYADSLWKQCQTALFKVPIALAVACSGCESQPEGTAAAPRQDNVATAVSVPEVSAVSSPDVKISSEQNTNSAVVIIDMQMEFVTRGGDDRLPENVKKLEGILESQLALIEAAKSRNIPILFLEYLNYGPTTDRLKAAVKDYSNTSTILKSSDGVFDDQKAKTQLTEFMSERKIRTLIIAGANGGACVMQCIRGSLENNYCVIAYTDGIANFNFHDFIYPYSDKYTFTSKNDATFRQANSIEELFRK